MNLTWLITYSIYSFYIQREEILLAKFRSLDLVDRSYWTLWQVCGKLPFDKNPSAERMFKSCMKYYRTHIKDDSPEKIAQKASQRENENKYSWRIMKGDGQAQLIWNPWTRCKSSYSVNTHKQDKGLAMTECCTKIVDYTTKYPECLRCNLVRWTQKLLSHCGFHQTKKISLVWSYNAMFSLSLMIGKWQNSKPKQHTELIQVMVETGLLGYSAAAIFR